MLKNFFVSLLLIVTTCAQAAFIEKTVIVSFPAEKPDQVSWIGLDFETGQTIVDPRRDAPNWHLRLRQGYVSTNSGAAAKVENTAFENLVGVPPASEFKSDESYDPWGPAPHDYYNETLMDWYKYHMFQGHLLSPKPYVFVVRTSSGYFVKLEFLDYVKEGFAIRSGKKVKVGASDGQVHVKLRYKALN